MIGYYEYWRKTKLDNNIITQDRKFKLFDNNNNFINEKDIFWKNRFVSINEIIELLKNHNFIIKEIYGNCNLEKFSESSEDIFIEAIKI